jgi:hypothetical protein
MDLFTQIREEILGFDTNLEKSAAVVTPVVRSSEPIVNEISAFLKQAKAEVQNFTVFNALVTIEKQGSAVPSALFNFVEEAEHLGYSKDEIIEHLEKEAGKETLFGSQTLGGLLGKLKGQFGIGSEGLAKKLATSDIHLDEATSMAPRLFGEALGKYKASVDPTLRGSVWGGVKGMFTGMPAKYDAQLMAEKDMLDIMRSQIKINPAKASEFGKQIFAVNPASRILC